MTDTLLREALSALKTKIEALASLETATAEEIVLLSTAVERIAGQAGASEVEQVAEEQRAALVAAAEAAAEAALQSITDALAAADAAISARREGGTFTGAVNFDAAITEHSSVLSSSGGIVTIDCNAGNKFTLTLTENVTGFSFLNVPPAGRSFSFVLQVVQDGAGSGFFVDWDPSFAWPDKKVPALTAEAGARDRFTFETDTGGLSWDVSPAGFNMGVPA